MECKRHFVKRNRTTEELKQKNDIAIIQEEAMKGTAELEHYIIL